MEKQLIPQLRFPDFKGEWKIKKVENILSIGSGKDYKHLEDGEIPVYGTGGYMTSVDEFLYNGESVCIGRKGTIDNPIFLNEKFWTVDTLFYTHSFKQVLPRFVYSLFQNINWYKHNEASGVPSLSKKTIEKININIPSLPEQQKIASFLSDVDDKITKLTKKKDLLEQYKKGIMQKIFNQELRFKDDDGNEFPKWEMKELGKITKYYDGTHQTPNYVSEGIPFYSVEHVTANQFEKTKFISKKVFDKENKRVRLEKGDILMTRIGNVGKARYIDWDVKASFYVSLALIKQNSSFSSKYLAQYINSVPFQRELWKRIIHVAFPIKINLGEIGKCLVQLPCIEEQTKIANFLSDIDVKIEALDTKIKNSQAFKKGVLQQMFV
tara:strand:+ start:1191 stop:2333 length:1143 start_codon:yes stop_codon:yes gene_type:complete